jgi:3-phosphoshikimate 1-carboxyvinyltransferase
MGAFSDQAITLAAIAPYGDSPTTITGIGHIRHQESDRIGAMMDALTRMGIQTEELEDGIRIWPGQPHAARIRTYDDHRVAMGFALTGLRADGIVIEDPGCCRKTFENYFEVLDDFVRKMQ